MLIAPTVIYFVIVKLDKSERVQALITIVASAVMFFVQLGLLLPILISTMDGYESYSELQLIAKDLYPINDCIPSENQLDMSHIE